MVKKRPQQAGDPTTTFANLNANVNADSDADADVDADANMSADVEGKICSVPLRMQKHSAKRECGHSSSPRCSAPEALFMLSCVLSSMSA